MSRPALFQSAPPDVAFSIDSGHVAAARLSGPAGKVSVVAHAIAPMPAGAVTPALVGANVHDAAAVARVVTDVLGQLGARTRRAALVMPDTVAKVSLIKFDTVPPRTADLLELVRWQVKKSAPFPIEQAVVSYTPGHRPADGGQEFVVSVARAEVIDQYERVCALAGVHAGLIDLATFSLVNGVLAAAEAPQGDWLVVHAAQAYTTLAVLRGTDIIYFRNQAEESDGPLADVVHQTAMYYEDRLEGSGFTRVLLSGTGTAARAADVRQSLEERLRVPVEALDPRRAAALTDRIDAAPELLEALAPLVGILLRERKAA